MVLYAQALKALLLSILSVKTICLEFITIYKSSKNYSISKKNFTIVIIKYVIYTT